MKKLIQFTIALGTAFFLMAGVAHAQCPHAKTACSKSSASAAVHTEKEAPASASTQSATPVIKVSQEAPASARTAPATAAVAGKTAACCDKQAKAACCDKASAKSCAGKASASAAVEPKEAPASATATMVKNQ